MDEIKNVPETQEQDLNEILRVRREKLDTLIANGKNIDSLYDIIEGKKIGTLFKAY